MSAGVSEVNGRKYLTVPWEKADEFRSKLAERGIGSTVCLRMNSRSAVLELWPGADPDRALAELVRMYPDAEWVGTDPNAR
jgi:hypothetical protein